MKIYHLKGLDGKVNKYRSLSIKPEVGSFVRIIKNPNNPILYNWPKLLKNLSTDRVYKVFKVTNTFEVYVKNDKNFTSTLTKSLYQIVEEVTEKEIKEYNEMLKVLWSFNKVLKNR